MISEVPMSQSQPLPPKQSESADEPAPEATEAEPAADPEEPLNRAARRAKAKQVDPSHVGPRAGHAREGHGARSHTKRRIS
jgi:hypothetical protein